MSIKLKLKTNPLTRIIYSGLKAIKDHHVEKEKTNYHGQFINRSHDSKYLCVILAGYKSYLYGAVFSRLKRYLIDDIDVCVVSSGKYSDELADICSTNGWSYLSTKENNVSLVQNVAIKLHPNAEYIFKLDEDIFITEGFFEGMLRAYDHASNGKFIPGVIAPIIPVNGYGHVRVLEKLNLVEEYEKRFNQLKCAAGNDRPIENSPQVARFFWGEGNIIPNIDELNHLFSSEPLVEFAVPIRFSIGAILFKRNLWDDMGGFPVVKDELLMMGSDERFLCNYCCLKSRPIMVSENVVVGHFSFGPQNEEMKKLFESNRSLFETES